MKLEKGKTGEKIQFFEYTYIAGVLLFFQLLPLPFFFFLLVFSTFVYECLIALAPYT